MNLILSMINNNEVNKYLCENHIKLNKKNIYPLSPCRGKCQLCKNKNVHGYNNPENISNPFGHLYLIPYICITCVDKNKKCMWCKII